MEKKPKASPRARATASPAKKTTTPKTTAAPRKRTVTAKAAAAPATTPATKPAVTKTASVHSSPTFAPNHGQIAAFAYSLFEQSGHQHGRAVEHWLEAESRLKQGLKL